MAPSPRPRRRQPTPPSRRCLLRARRHGLSDRLWAFAQALRSIATAVADAVFFAGATAVIAVVGVVLLGETLTARKAVALVLIVVGVAALRLGAGHG